LGLLITQTAIVLKGVEVSEASIQEMSLTILWRGNNAKDTKSVVSSQRWRYPGSSVLQREDFL
jgi:hypothetical protein